MTELICLLLQAFVIIVFVRIVLSWFPATSDGLLAQVQRLTFSLTEWAMAPLRRAIPAVRLGGAALDLSPMIILIGIFVLQGFLRC